ncbi:MAG: 50S ribosomal protein L24 [Caldisericota bacterium]|jgi:large subunit ribosomal protein L24|nr:50S ribosomal protein L24 [Caldisericota bacterium]
MKGILKFLNIRKGDTVVVKSGKDKGNKGKVIKTIPGAGKIVVEGINMVSKAMRPTQQMPQGKIARREAPILASKVMVLCPNCHQPTRIAHRLIEGDKSVRACKVCSETIDKA